jgi:hypothetical protein
MLTLQCWDEASGKLKGCELREEYLLLTFESWGETVRLIAVPSDVHKFLKNSIGKYINILRTDLENNPYCFNIASQDTKDERIDRTNEIDERSKIKNGVYLNNWQFITETQQTLNPEGSK